MLFPLRTIVANKEGMNKQMEKGKGREQWGRESCCWKEDDAGCVPLPMLDWGPCHPAWHGGQCQGLLQNHTGLGSADVGIAAPSSQRGDAAFIPARWGCSLSLLEPRVLDGGSFPCAMCVTVTTQPCQVPGYQTFLPSTEQVGERCAARNRGNCGF